MQEKEFLIEESEIQLERERKSLTKMASKIRERIEKQEKRWE